MTAVASILSERRCRLSLSTCVPLIATSPRIATLVTSPPAAAFSPVIRFARALTGSRMRFESTVARPSA